jgi:hypothetical protein
MTQSQSKCAFSTDISEQLSCSPDGRFTDNGYSIKDCPLYPCERYNELAKEINDLKIEQMKEIKSHE